MTVKIELGLYFTKIIISNKNDVYQTLFKTSSRNKYFEFYPNFRAASLS